MKKETTKGLNRRDFLGLSAIGLTGLTILPSYVIDGIRMPPSDRVLMGTIGLGRQSLSDFRGFAGAPGLQIVACCDVDTVKQERYKRTIEEWQKSKGLAPRCDTYEQYEKLLERKDIDVVEVVSPDHWHALMTIHACQAGKDVYVQKPLSYTIREALVMTRVANDTKRVVQVGSQQRSSREFQKAIELVQAGAIGHIEKIYAKVGDPPKPYDLPATPVPGNLNWNLWLGPLNDDKITYHPDLAPPISLNPVQNEAIWGAWRWYLEMGNGYTADWGAHMFDIAQAAIGMDGSAPYEIIPQGYKGQPYMTFKYLSGVVMTEQPYLEDNPGAQGIKFIGTKGWIEVARGYIGCSDPSLIPAEIAGNRPQPRGERPPAQQQAQRPAAQGRQATAQAAAQGRPAPTQAGLQFEISSPHMQNFVDCVRSRKKPTASIEVGCSTAITCCLGNIAHELKRPVKWDPATFTFVDDAEACNHRLMHYEYRRPYKL
ncbi:MAG: Gfo/Idh/MocA family oxidoreductase [Bacteroidales bacterium]|nr:Gfo/Idh/MocA family oxidoreductase [Bacteroidales bacterium]